MKNNVLIIDADLENCKQIKYSLINTDAEVGIGKPHAYILAVTVHNLFSSHKTPTIVAIIFDEVHKHVNAARQMYGMNFKSAELERLSGSIVAMTFRPALFAAPSADDNEFTHLRNWFKTKYLNVSRIKMIAQDNE